MAIWYVDNAATGTNAGTSWTNAWTAFGSAITNVTAAGDVIYISHTHDDILATDTVYTIGANHVQSNPLKIYSVNKTGDALTKGASIGHKTSNRSIDFRGNNTGLYLYGVTLLIAGTVSDSIDFFSVTGTTNSCFLENCSFYIKNTGSTCEFQFGFAGNTSANVLKITFLDCDFWFGNVSQFIRTGSSDATFINCSMSVGTTHPTNLIKSTYGGAVISLMGCDLSNNDVIFAQGTYGQLTGFLQQCKLKSGFALIAASMTGYAANVTLLDCDSGDVHYRIGHADFLGELQVDTGIYCNDNITDVALSWKIVSSANTSFTMPYKTPWISVYHDGTSAITPYLEILRSGSSTAFTDAEVWAEWSYKGTSGSTRATVNHDRCVQLGTPVAQTSSSKTATDWTGENATSWFGKIGPSSSVTPAEVGYMSFRICVGVASTTVYVDPQIRGRV